MAEYRQLLIDGLAALGLPDDEDKLNKLIAFIELIAKWNKAYNLTAIRDKSEMASLHILDSLAILPHLHGQSLIDIGTGAGLPAIPLAIYRPEMEFLLLDSNSKKTRFVQQAILELKLKNASVHHGRVEDFKTETGFDTVTCRAFASMENIMQLTAHLFSDNGILLAMKAQQTNDELNKLKQNYQVISLKVPNIEAERCLICIESKS